MTFHDLFRKGLNLLQSSYPQTAQQETLVFLCEAFQFSKSAYLTKLKDFVSDEKAKTIFFNYITERLTGKPLDLVLGYTMFIGKKYMVSENILLPRPETEILVSEAISHIRNLNHHHLVILECGFGTGVISCELGKAFPEVTIHAYDVSRETLSCAQKNANLHRVTNVNWHIDDFLKGGWKTGIPEEAYVVLISNPPYISTSEIENLDKIVQKYDPWIALDGGKDGLVFYRYFFKEISQYIDSFICEIGFDQKDRLEELAVKNKVHIGFKKDYQGIDRVALVQRDICFRKRNP